MKSRLGTIPSLGSRGARVAIATANVFEASWVSRLEEVIHVERKDGHERLRLQKQVPQAGAMFKALNGEKDTGRFRISYHIYHI